MPRGDWRSYDSVVDAYDQAAVPRFHPLARDLVAAVAPREGARVLDVGTGTGLAARLARDAVGHEGFVVGIDPSIAMLERAVGRGVAVIVGMLPGLPFPDETFDAVTANLVLSHLSDYDAGLADVVRVLGRRGRFGCTAWGPDAPGEDVGDWAKADEIFESFARAHGIEVTPPTPPVPSEEKLRQREGLEAALRDAGLVDLDITPHTYRWKSSIDEYFVGRAWRPAPATCDSKRTTRSGTTSTTGPPPSSEASSGSRSARPVSSGLRSPPSRSAHIVLASPTCRMGMYAAPKGGG